MPSRSFNTEKDLGKLKVVIVSSDYARAYRVTAAVGAATSSGPALTGSTC